MAAPIGGAGAGRGEDRRCAVGERNGERLRAIETRDLEVLSRPCPGRHAALGAPVPEGNDGLDFGVGHPSSALLVLVARGKQAVEARGQGLGVAGRGHSWWSGEDVHGNLQAEGWDRKLRGIL